MNSIVQVLGLPETVTVSIDVLAPITAVAVFILFQFMWRDYDRRQAALIRKIQNVPTKEWTHLALYKAYASQKQQYRFAGRMPEKWHRLFLECLKLEKELSLYAYVPQCYGAKQELILNTLKGWSMIGPAPRSTTIPGESPLLTSQQGGKFLFDVFGTEQCPPDDVYEAMSGFVVR